MATEEAQVPVPSGTTGRPIDRPHQGTSEEVPNRPSLAQVAAGKVSISGLQGSGGGLLWSESRPLEGGRRAIVRCQESGVGWERPVEITRPSDSAVSRVHEYGGGAVLAAGEQVFWVDATSQRWFHHNRAGSGEVSAVGPDTTSERRRHHGDGRLTADGSWLISVQEVIDGPEVRHQLVAHSLDDAGAERVLVQDSDFVSAPRPSPDGRWLAWMAWNHPDMPWDHSTVLVAPVIPGSNLALGPAVVVAGGPGRSVGQPTWCADGSLLVLDDRTGWWLPYRIPPEDLTDPRRCPGEPLVDVTEEFHGPDWALGVQTVVELDDGSIATRVHRSGRDHLDLLTPPESGPRGRPWKRTEVEQPCLSITGVATPDGHSLALSGSTDAVGATVVVSDRSSGAWTPVSGSGINATEGGRPVRGEFLNLTVGDHQVPGFLYRPDDGEMDTSGPPPLVVLCHGGPTGASDPGFDPLVAVLTGQGMAVAKVDYRGSSGYGRVFRDALRGRWGVADVEDCRRFAQELAAMGRVDGSKMAIRGSSAGGLTALAAMVDSDVFLGAVSWYGVTNLEALAAETHDFESRYLDGLVGPLPDAQTTYVERSPLYAADRVGGQILLLQGEMDPVVPADQSKRFAEALTAAGVPCRLEIFPDERHGFRRSETIEAALRAELDFYQHLFQRPGDRS